jgi:hypothetical protein
MLNFQIIKERKELKKMNLISKKYKFIFNHVFFFMILIFAISMNFKSNNIFALESKDFSFTEEIISDSDIKEQKEENSELDNKKIESIDGHELYLKFKYYVLDISDAARYITIYDFIKTQVKPLFEHYQEDMTKQEVSDQCMESIMKQLQDVYLNQIDEIRNQVTDGFFIIFFNFA